MGRRLPTHLLKRALKNQILKLSRAKDIEALTSSAVNYALEKGCVTHNRQEYLYQALSKPCLKSILCARLIPLVFEQKKAKEVKPGLFGACRLCQYCNDILCCCPALLQSRHRYLKLIFLKHGTSSVKSAFKLLFSLESPSDLTKFGKFMQDARQAVKDAIPDTIYQHL